MGRLCSILLGELSVLVLLVCLILSSLLGAGIMSRLWIIFHTINLSQTLNAGLRIADSEVLCSGVIQIQERCLLKLICHPSST